MAFSGAFNSVLAVFLLGVVGISLVTSDDYDVATNVPSTDIHNLFEGTVTEGERLLYDQVIYEAARRKRLLIRLFRYVARNLKEMNDNNSRNEMVLTRIEVRDLSVNNAGGYPTLIGGGIGKNYVRLRLISQRGNEINFNIKVYGKQIE